jgi:hypothetical protein
MLVSRESSISLIFACADRRLKFIYI